MTKLRVDLREHLVYRNEKRVDVGRREFRLLACLARRPGHVISRDELMHFAWMHVVSSAALDVAMARLRKAVGRDVIRTVYGGGYALEAIDLNLHE